MNKKSPSRGQLVPMGRTEPSSPNRKQVAKKLLGSGEYAKPGKAQPEKKTQLIEGVPVKKEKPKNTGHKNKRD